MNKRLSKKLGVAGGGAIAVGIIVLIGGIVCGILCIVQGAIVLGSRKDLEI